MKKISLTLLICLFFLSLQIHADTIRVEVEGVAYNVTTSYFSYNDNPSLITDQIWWGNEALATKFAQAVQFDLGKDSDSLGPRFAFVDSITDENQYLSKRWCPDYPRPQCVAQGAASYYDLKSEVLWIATASPVPIPAGVWLFGSGLIGLIGVARRKKP